MRYGSPVAYDRGRRNAPSQISRGSFNPTGDCKKFNQHVSKQKLPTWVRTFRLNPATKSQIAEWLDKEIVDAGEADAIGLAVQVRCDWFLTDDAQARQFAESLGLETHGSIGLLLWAVATGRVDNRQQAHHLLDSLAQSSLWISERVLREARQTLDRNF